MEQGWALRVLQACHCPGLLRGGPSMLLGCGIAWVHLELLLGLDISRAAGMVQSATAAGYLEFGASHLLSPTWKLPGRLGLGKTRDARTR